MTIRLGRRRRALAGAARVGSQAHTAALEHTIADVNQTSVATALRIASVGTLLMDRRKQQSLGENWARFAAVSSNLPFLAILQGRNKFSAAEIGWRNPAIGLALYALVFWFHPALFGIRAY